MAVKEQWETVKKNWLIFLVLIVLVLALSNFSFGNVSVFNGAKYAQESFATDNSYRGGNFVPGSSGDFAPDVETRKIVYTGNIAVEVKHGKFDSAELEFEQIVDSRDAIILNRNVNSYDVGFFERKVGYYNVRVEVDDLDDFMDDLKDIGKVTSFNKDSRDVTGNYVSLEEQLAIEQDRLTRFQNLLSQSDDIGDRIELIDKISEQERRVYYIQDALNNQDQRIEYSEIGFSLEEKPSSLSNLSFVTIGDLIKSFVGSLSGLIKLVFVLLPWAIIIGLIWFIVRKFKK